MCALQTLLLAMACSSTTDAAQINPVPRAVLTEELHEWAFDRDSEGWTAENNCRTSAGSGPLTIEATDADPFLHCPVNLRGGQVALRIRARCRGTGPGTVYWTTDQSPQRGEDKVAALPLTHDGQWHEFTTRFVAPGRLTDLRLDPGQDAGKLEVDWIRLIHEEPHPLTIELAGPADRCFRFRVKNDRSTPLEFTAAGKSYRVDGADSVLIERPVDTDVPLCPVSIDVQSQGLPPVGRTVFLHHGDAQADWIVRPLGDCSLRVARDGTLARIDRQGQPVAVLGPLVHCAGKLPVLKLVKESPSLVFEGRGIRLEVSVEGQELSVSIDGRRPCEGPVVRAFGALEQGLLAGLEYLGKGERSSSKLDIETAEHLRFAPDRLKVTLPLMAFVTDRVSLAMTWTDMTLQPVYATPNFFDGADDHRMALRGQKIRTTIRVDRVALEETILWAVNKQGLPPLPKPPRSADLQRAIELKALNGPLKTEDGWGHCVQDQWARRPFADVASTLWRLTGEVPDLPQLVPGGAHVENASIYFVTGRAQQWLDYQTARVQGILRQQQPDGSFRYDGKYRRGHFENTASGVCCRPAAQLLDFARATGDQTALEAGVRTLEYMKRFRTPRGAQVWEVPLHTPDQLASANLVWAYVRGYELTGKDEYLQLARRWALSGVPFTYLWQCHPIMLYSTPPVFGATFWRHSWFGLPVQWVGGVYAYALTMLAPYDDTLDWNHLARGILISAHQQQYPDGPHVGLLPDSFGLANQQRRPADINPCALASLRRVLDGQLDSLSVAIDGPHRIVAPFPVHIRNGVAHIRAKAGMDYQVIVDGSRVVDVKSRGKDKIPLQ